MKGYRKIGIGKLKRKRAELRGKLLALIVTMVLDFLLSPSLAAVPNSPSHYSSRLPDLPTQKLTTTFLS